MTHPQFLKKLIWAVDAFEETNEIQLHTIETLKLFANMIQTQVQPVYVLNPDQLDIPMELSQPFLDRYEISAKKSLEHILRKADINGLLPPKILIHQKTSLRGATQALLSYAMSVSASAIVVGSHGRSGLERFFLGSFSESLTLQSKLPVLIVGTKTKTQNEIKEILFPTDFAENSFEVFLKVVKLATELNAKIFLLHIIPNPIEPVVQSGIYLLGGGWVPVAAYKEKEEEKQRKIAEQWMSWAIEHQASVELIMDLDSKKVSDTILEYAKKMSGVIIAMAAQSGQVASTLLGSISRQVTRNAPCPILLMRIDD